MDPYTVPGPERRTIMTNETLNVSSAAADRCTAVPEFDRLNYFYGQMLSARDFKSEQDFFREKLKLHNRCLHGYGVVCGLEVCAVEPPPKPCPPPDPCLTPTPNTIVI